MRKYESTIVFNPSLSDAQVKQELVKFESLLEARKVQNLKADHMGKRDLAYLVKKNKSGKFVCLSYEATDYACVEELTSLLRITDSVIKFQSHRLNDRVRKFKGNPKRQSRGESFDDDYSDSLDADF